MKLSSSDRSALIRLASQLPAGAPERRTILSGLKKARKPHRMITFEMAGPLPRGGLLPSPERLQEKIGPNYVRLEQTGRHYDITTFSPNATDAVLDWIEEHNIPYAIN